MKHKTLRGLQLVLGLLLFAAGSPRPGGLELLVQQIEVMGARHRALRHTRPLYDPDRRAILA